MSKARWLVPSLAFALAAAALSACSNGDDRPSSLVSGHGNSGHAGNSAGHGGGAAGSAEQPDNDAGPAAGDGGAAGQANLPDAPLAIFPAQLQIDVGCGGGISTAELLIQNGGPLPLTIASAEVTAGYTVDSELPLQIPAWGNAILLLSAAPKQLAGLGDKSTGTLTFVTNEVDSPRHDVHLDTTVFGGRLEFTDRADVPLKGSLSLTYLSSDVCPDSVKYRVHNTGNLAFSLLGPTFSEHLRGTTSGASGHDVPPDGYIELEVSGKSAADGACSGSGELSFTVEGPLCSPAPKLAVSWPANVATSGCNCGAAPE
jgi:hypothetical protein